MDGGSTVSKIIEIGKKSKMEFEHVHARTKNNNDERGNSYGKNLVLECDHKTKEVREKCENDQKHTMIGLKEIFV